MGFLSGFGRLLQSKPIYTPEDVNGSGQQPMAATTPGADPRDAEVPVVRMGRANTRPDGAGVDLYVHIKNESNERLRVRQARLLGMHRDLDIDLSPGESNEVLLLNDIAKIRQQPQGWAELDYATEAGNYLQSRHEIRSQRENDGDYVITEFILRLPIKDI